MAPSNSKSTTLQIAHHLPCTISYRGVATKSYLIASEYVGLQSFRGRKLERGEFKIPDSHEVAGIEIDAKENANVKFKLDSKGTFYDFSDSVTEKRALPNALRWLNIATELHAPSDTTEVAVIGDYSTKRSDLHFKQA